MRLVRNRCTGCGSARYVCSECGSEKVSVDGRGGNMNPLNVEFGTFARVSDPPETLEYALVCWGCGEMSERVMRLEAVS